ncbi:MAG: 5-(carboxyamino)imidazole ribonucleotide mutase [Elusimicrobia bacterium RIFCSPLOWO2_01_FULL_60_11]|nr:MAG: 5-(carboxyamino)imidazole ribonucleotide mutase [Elusimicrobia bacterium RIFCSPLOWO2_01_FULL_60_11]
MAQKPLVGIVMGSDSDLPVMKEAAEALDGFGIPYEIKVISAHRNPKGAFEYASKAKSRGLKVMIAGAGGAAHLPGVIAALTPLPVIGVPVKTSKLSGLDSLLSIVQMPDGIPVATVAINGARNAGILAAQMLSLADAKTAQEIEKFKANLKTRVEAKSKELGDIGWKLYIEKHKL